MSVNQEYKLVIMQKGKEVVSKVLSHEDVKVLIASFPDDGASDAILECAAKHSSYGVRGEVAKKQMLPEVALKILVADSVVDVLRSLVASASFKKFATTEVLEHLISRDPGVAQYVARSISDYDLIDAHRLAAKLSKHPDLSVVQDLTISNLTARPILKQLTTHKDPLVASRAQHLMRFEP